MLRRAAQKGLKYGDVTRFAKQLGVSVSTVSRIISKKRRHRTVRPMRQPGTVDETKLRHYALNTKLVEAVFHRLLTPKEWFDYVGGPRYHIESLQYIYAMCSFNKLPQSWQTVRVGESWLIFHVTLGVRSKWVKPASKSK